jgi:hypothetical protein
MVPQGSTSCSQEPSTGPYPEPGQSSPYHPILSLYNPFIIIIIIMAFPSNPICSDIPKWLLVSFIIIVNW